MAKQIDKKFLLKTDCTFLIDNFIERVKLEFPEFTVLNCVDAGQFIENATAVSLFDEDKKIIVLKELLSDDLDAISSIVNNNPEDVWVIIQRQTLPRVKAYTVIKGACRYIAIKDLNESQCAVWVRKWLDDIQLIFSEDIPSYIVSRVGTDITKLRNEVRKVAFYFAYSEDKVLTQSSCDEFFSENIEAQYFILVENFFRKRVKEVIEELKKIDEYSLIKLLFMLIGQTEKIYKVAILREQKMSAEDIGEILSIPKFIISAKFFSYLSFFNKTKLIMLLDLFNELDTKMRLTKLPKPLLFESYILKALKI